MGLTSVSLRHVEGNRSVRSFFLSSVMFNEKEENQNSLFVREQKPTSSIDRSA